jgi:hypothetical protein
MDRAHPTNSATRTAQRRRTTRTRALIVGALFSLLLATGLVIGTSLIPDPPPELRIAPPSEFRTGRILYALPSGMVCRHVKFDNVTGEIGDLGTGPCEYADQTVTGGIRRPGMSNPRGFTWNR